jgi:hypothetical protein
MDRMSRIEYAGGSAASAFRNLAEQAGVPFERVVELIERGELRSLFDANGKLIKADSPQQRSRRMAERWDRYRTQGDSVQTESSCPACGFDGYLAGRPCAACTFAGRNGTGLPHMVADNDGERAAARADLEYRRARLARRRAEYAPPQQKRPYHIRPHGRRWVFVR